MENTKRKLRIMKSKITIITEYYNSSNYGGNLQAYALTRFLNTNGYTAEQLQYKRPLRSFKDDWRETEGLGNKLALFTKKVIQKTLKRSEFNRVKKRRKLVINFGRTMTPHTEGAYSDQELEEFNNGSGSQLSNPLTEFGIFITGSDQVWRTIDKRAYFLTFVPKGKKKLSYAASISKGSLTEREKKFFAAGLRDFVAVSVREKSDVALLKDIYTKDVEWVLDPTLLLDEGQWAEITSPRLRKEKYVFCYFLGGEKEPRQIARAYAERHGLKLLTMPYLTGGYPFMDFFIKKGNEERLFEVGVEDFLSLIKYAEYVFTDSFHAVVFSGIFKTQYFVFERAISVSMNSRIKSLVEIYETSERFCDTKEKERMEYLESLEDIDYSRELLKLESMKKKSKKWLLENVK